MGTVGARAVVVRVALLSLGHHVRPLEELAGAAT